MEEILPNVPVPPIADQRHTEPPAQVLDIDVIELLKKFSDKTGQPSQLFELGVRTGRAKDKKTGEELQVYQVRISWAIADIMVASGKNYKQLLTGLWELLDKEESVAKLKANIARADMQLGVGGGIGGAPTEGIVKPSETPVADTREEQPAEDKKKFVKSYGESEK